MNFARIRQNRPPIPLARADSHAPLNRAAIRPPYLIRASLRSQRVGIFACVGSVGVLAWLGTVGVVDVQSEPPRATQLT